MKIFAMRHAALWILIFASFTAAQEWGDPVNLGNGYTPDMDIDPVTGRVYVVHHDNGLVYTMLDAKGVILTQERVDVASGDAIGRGQYGATIAFDPKTQQPHLCFRILTSNDRYNVFYIRRRPDNTWSAQLRIVNNVERAYSVRMDVDSKGVAHVVHGQVNGVAPSGVATYLRITNGALSQTIEGFDIYRTDDRVEIAVGGDDAVNLMLSNPAENANGSILNYYQSTDGGATVVRIADVHDAATAKGRNGNVDIFADKSGIVHIAYGSSGFPSTANGGPRTLHYVRYAGTDKIRDVQVNDPDELQFWDDHGLGIGSVAASDDGKYVVMAYVTRDAGQLRARLSSTQGETWSAPSPLASQCGGDGGRDKQVVRARNNTFYLAYPSSGRVYLRTLKAANDAPSAVPGGPYTGVEGTPIQFDAAGSTADGAIAQYRWDWTGDGVWDDSSAAVKMSHTYLDDFTGTARLEVKDASGMRGVASAQVTVRNALPRADAGGPYFGGLNRPVGLSASATDPGTLDTFTFKWDLDNNGSFEIAGKDVNTSYNNLGTRTVRVQVTDDNGGVGTDSATVEIRSGVPLVNQIPNQTVPENTPFAPVQLDNYVTDVDHQDNQILWTASGNTRLVVTIQNRIATVAVPDSEFAGQEQITFTAKDPDNNTASTTATFRVTAINEPPVVSTMPSPRVNEGNPFANIMLDNFVFDPDHNDAQISWRADGQVSLTVAIVNRIATVAPADSEWAGFERITFVAKDPAGAEASTQVRFTIDPVNDPPRINPVPEQGVNRGANFPPLDLTSSTKDPDDLLSTLEITPSGNSALNVVMNGLVATVFAPNAQWVGSEQITFTVRDPNNASSTRVITFSVRDVNTPPRWLNVRDYTFHEDDTLKIPLTDMRARVADNEDAAANFSFYLTGSRDIKAFSTLTHFNMYATLDWSGEESVQLVVHDGRGGRDTVATQVTVLPVIDGLRAFGVITPIGLFYSVRPFSLTFIWEATTDPEHPGSTIDYLWTISENPEFTQIADQKSVKGTTLTYNLTNALTKSTYYWNVQAFSSSGLNAKTKNIGSFALPPVSVAEREPDVPVTFALKQNYPNPFNPQTTITFDLARTALAIVTIYDIEGKALTTLVNETLRAGNHQRVWQAEDLASGIYFVELRVLDEGKLLYQARQKMSLVR
ncbi:MAG: Ig-like domain-containing protein [bacterium]